MTASSADLAQVAVRLAGRGESFPPRAAIEIGVAVLEALGGARTQWIGGPAGVRLTAAGEVSVTSSPDPALPRAGGGPGDVYAAAALVIELLAAEPIGDTAGEEEHERRLDDLMTGIAAQLGTSHPARATLALLRVALAPSPCDRPDAYALAEAFADLARALPGERLDAFAARVVPFAAALPPVPVPSGIPASRTLRPALAVAPPTRGRSRAVVAAIVGLLALGGLVAGGAVALWAAVVHLRSPAGAEPPEHQAHVRQPANEVPAVDLAPAVGIEPEPAVAPELSSEPEPVVAPEPAAEPEPAPAVPEAQSPPAEAALPPPRVEKALVSMADADRLVVTCGDKAEAGTRSVRIEDFPGGHCTVQAWVLGQTYRAEPAMDRVGQWTCALADGALVCDG